LPPLPLVLLMRYPVPVANLPPVSMVWGGTFFGGAPKYWKTRKKAVEREVCPPAQAPEEAENVLTVLQMVEHVVGHLLRGEGQAAQAHRIQVPVVGRQAKTITEVLFFLNRTTDSISVFCHSHYTAPPPPPSPTRPSSDFSQ
jgi:hypothetical protein